MAEHFLTYRKSLWFKITLGAAIGLVAVYYGTHDPTIPSGRTAIGLTYGILGLLAILLLMGYRFRKRAYYATYGSLQAWLSFHVYVGLLTVLLILLHAGFKFGLDIHTLAFALVVLVVLSGVVGTLFYLAVPRQFSRYGAELAKTGKDNIHHELHTIVRQMRALSRDKSDAFAQKCEAEIQHGVFTAQRRWRHLFSGYTPTDLSAHNEAFQEHLQNLPEAEYHDFTRLGVLATQKRDLEDRLAAQMRLQNRLEAWMYIHLPASIVMLVVVAFHIFLVLYYGLVSFH